jgi:quercetin dioxygenase-like cupin family protein
MLNRMRYVKVVPTPDGGSAFEDAEFEQVERSIGEDIPPVLASAPQPVSAAVFVTSPAHLDVMDPHQAPARQFVIVLEGELEAETTDGQTRRFGPGEIALVEDTTGRGHISRILKHPTSLVMIPLA